MNRLRGKHGIVTGAARGIGAAIASIFAQEGASVIVADILQEEGKAIVDALQQQGGCASFIASDVSQEQQVRDLLRAALNTFGPVDILVNNAAILHHRDTSLVEIPLQVWEEVLSVNLRGPMLCSKYTLRHMIQQERTGSIIFIASIAALIGCSQPYSQDAYTAAKGGILALSRSIATQFGCYGIRCNTIVPGPIVTPLTAHFFETEQERKRRLDVLALPRLGTPLDIAQAALFLAEQTEGFLTGQELIIDGGATALLY